MIKSYDYANLGLRLREIRKDLGFTQVQVSEKIEITDRALYNIETGKNPPKIQTLEKLSALYGVNLFKELENYSSSVQITSMMNILQGHILKGEKNEIQEYLTTILDLDKDYKAINQLEIKQFNHFLLGLKFRYGNEKNHLDMAIKEIEEALTLRHEDFSVYNLNRFPLTLFELRLLFLMGACYSLKFNQELSIKVYDHILSKLDLSESAQINEKLMIIKCYSSLSYAYHLDNHFKASLNSAEDGIKYCIKHNLNFQLPFLLFRKSIALAHLKKFSTWEKYMLQSLNMLEILGDETKYKLYREQYDLYKEEIQEKISKAKK